jgi:hypothetical protein
VSDWLGVDALQGREFGAGLRAGLLALGVGAAAGVVWHLVRRAPLPAAGLLLVVAAGWGLGET